MDNFGNSYLYCVVTIAEAAEWWGENQQALLRFMIRRSIEVDDPTSVIRKSKGTWLTTIDQLIKYKGEPKNERPIYEN